MDASTMMVATLLWYENDAGDRWIPPPDSDPLNPQPPTGYHYQVSRFPCQLRTTHLRVRPDGGSEMLLEATQSWPEDLVLAMAKGKRGRGLGLLGWRFPPLRLSEAIILAATSCERCLNRWAWLYDLGWGYPSFSKEYAAANTSCEQCK